MRICVVVEVTAAGADVVDVMRRDAAMAALSFTRERANQERGDAT